MVTRKFCGAFKQIFLVSNRSRRGNYNAARYKWLTNGPRCLATAPDEHDVAGAEVVVQLVTVRFKQMLLDV